MPDISASDHTIFTEASRIANADARRQYLDRACGDDSARRETIERMLQASERDDGFLESPPPGLDEIVDELTVEPAGTRIGPYILGDRIGEGGFGVVYQAEQQDPRRQVALKVLRPGMDSRQIVARFEGERQALALMDHPNIARVYDAGTTASGRPYFVMELVEGRRSITDYCDSKKLSMRQRLALFIDACHAVQHAHQRGIIHRDIKPSNILVTETDAHAVVKVIDFGIAKALEQPLADTALATGAAQILGTPLYMSPEQAAMTGDVDTRSDVYSLGVLLYELLTGTTPFDKQRLEKATFDEMRQIIREEEPPRPSDRVTTVGQAETTAADDRKTDRGRLRSVLRGELDWIVMRSMDKDRLRRYQSAKELADDVQRYLGGEAVLACPPSMRYRVGKFLRRHRGPVSAGVALLVVLLLGIAGTTTGMIRARHEATRATDARESELRQLYAADLLLASRAVVDGPLSRAIDLLDGWLPERRDGKDYRGREWHMLRRLCDTSIMTLKGHDGPLRALAWSRDGKYLASGGKDCIVRIWDAENGQCQQTLIGHAGGIFDVAFSPNGKRLASASADATVRLWDVETGNELHVLRGHILPVYAVAFHPDGLRLVSGGGDTIIKIWDATTGREIGALQGQEASIGSLQFDATGKRLASRGIVRGSLMWDFDKRVVIDLFKTAGITLTPDFTLGAFAFPSGHLGIYDVEKKAADKNDVGLKAIHSVIPDDTGRFYAFGGGDDTIRVVDAAIGAILVTHRGHIGSAARILLRHDVRRLASAGEDGTVRIWEVPDPNEYKPYSGHHQTKVTAIDFSQDGEFLATGDYHGSIAIWNSSTGVREQVLGSHFVRRKINNKIPLEVGTNKPMTAGIAVKSVTSFVAPASIRDPIIECLTVQGHGGEVKSVAFTPDKRMVVSAGAKSFIIWDRISRQPVFEYEHPAIVSSMALSSDGTIAATGCWDDLVRVFRVPSGELIMTLEGHADDVMSVAFHPSGKELATGSRDQTVAIWDLATGKIKHQLRRHTNTVSVVRYTPDGKRLISGGMDGAIHVWNSATGQYEATLHGHLDGVTSMVLSGDGQWLVSASDGNDDKAVRVWLWNVDRFREGALVGGGFRGPSAVTIDPVTGDLIWGRVDLIRYRASPFSGNVSINAPPIFPEVTSATVAREDRLKVLGYSLIDEIGVWPTSDTTKVKPNQPGEKFLCVAVSLPFAKLKIGEADYLLRMEARRKDPEETLPSRASTMLMIPKRFVLVNRAGESRPADYVGRFAMRESDGFEFMGKGMSFLEDPTMTPQPQDRVLVYLAWEVLADFKLDGLNLRHQAEEAVPMPSVALTSFRPAMPFHPGSRSFLPSEGEGRLRSQMSRSPVP